MNVPEPLIAAVAVVGLGMLTAIGKLYADLKTERKERRDDDKANTNTLITTHKMVHEYIDKLETLVEAKRRGGIR